MDDFLECAASWRAVSRLQVTSRTSVREATEKSLRGWSSMRSPASCHITRCGCWQLPYVNLLGVVTERGFPERLVLHVARCTAGSTGLDFARPGTCLPGPSFWWRVDTMKLG